MQDIHDIRPPVMVGLDPGLVKTGLIAAAVLAGAVLLFFWVRWFLKRRKKAVTDLVPAPVPPFDQAMGALDRLKTTPVNDPKTFYFDLAALFKTYIGRSFGIHAAEMTTQELVRELRRTAMNTELMSRVSRFQTLSDPFRYAPVVPDARQTRSDLETAETLIREIEAGLNPPDGEGE